MKKEKSKQKFVYVLSIVVAAVFAFNIYLIVANFSVLKEIKNLKNESLQYGGVQSIINQLNFTKDPLSLQGFAKYGRDEVSVNPQEILLTKNCTQLNIVTNEYQAYTIETGLKGRVDIRPTAHDIMRIMLNYFNMTLLDVRITETKDKHFFSRMIFVQGNKILNVDAKASDAIALAVRTNSPIYVNNNIIQSISKKIC